MLNARLYTIINMSFELSCNKLRNFHRYSSVKQILILNEYRAERDPEQFLTESFTWPEKIDKLQNTELKQIINFSSTATQTSAIGAKIVAFTRLFVFECR